MISKFCISLFIMSVASTALAKVNVITTTTNVENLVRKIGGEHVSVESLTKGSQDPHYVEAKPSFMMKAARTDLLVSIGMDLEIGWLPSILKGARNRDIMPGGKGSLVLGKSVRALEIPSSVSRDQGDVHPDGNPHFMLDPIRAGAAGLDVAKKLGELDPNNSSFFTKRAQAFQTKMTKLHKKWKEELDGRGVKEIVTYHKTLTYFLNTMGIRSLTTVEPKPGVPPTAGHILGVIKLVKSKKIKLILVENYFETTAALRVQKSAPEVVVKSVPISVGGAPGVTSLENLYQSLVGAFDLSSKR